MSGLHGPRRGRRRRRSMMRPVTRRRKKTVLLPPSVFGQREAGSGAMRAKKKRGRQVGGRVGAHFAVWQCLAVLAGATLVGVCVWGATCTERPHLDPELRAKEDAIKFHKQQEQEQQQQQLQLQERAVSARPPTQRWAAGDSGGRAGGDGQSPVPGHSFWPADDGRQFEWAPHSRQALPSAEGAPPARPLLSENSATPEPAASEAPDAGRQLAGRKQQPASSRPADVQVRTGDAPGRETSSPETSSRNNDQPEVEPRGNGLLAPPFGARRRRAPQAQAEGAQEAQQRHNELMLEDQPAHTSGFRGSLAKKKLLDKSEASMVNHAQVNGKANLVCDIVAPSADDSVALILWYKDDSLAPIYTVDARKVGSLDRAKNTFDEQYSSRISFNHRTRPAYLELADVRQEDEGDYRCRVDFQRGRTVNTIISLRVVVPPDDLSIFLGASSSSSASASGQLAANKSLLLTSTSLSGQRKLSGLIGPFNEGDELQLVCLAHGGKPRPQLTWRRDFNLIESAEQNVDKEGTSVTLKIPTLNKSHLLSIFTCQATNSNLSSSTLQSSITLDLNLKPEEISLKQVHVVPHSTQTAGPMGRHEQSSGANSGQQLLAGQVATFECVTHGSRPQATIHWIFQGQKYEPPIDVDQQQTSSRLQLTIQRSHNQQALTCVAQNPRIPSGSASLSQTIKLDVHYPPQLYIKLDGPSGNAPSQTNSDDDPLRIDSNTSAATSSPAGSQPLELRSRQQNIQEGNDIYMSCQMEANPKPAKPVLWRFNGKPMQQQQQQNVQAASDRQQLHSAGSAEQESSSGAAHSAAFVITNQSLVLRKVTRHQSGAYTCEASNQHGTNVSKALELDIRHAPVCLTDNIMVFEAAVGQTIILDCAVQANPSKYVHYSWFASKAAEHEQHNISDWLARDASMDDQIDELGSKLKLKIRDESQSSVLVKCKAKNEVGLQQRACLFQIMRARVPTLRHSCSLAPLPKEQERPANSLLVECKQNEQLKTDESQMAASGNSGPQADQGSLRGSGGGSGGAGPTWTGFESPYLALKSAANASDQLQQLVAGQQQQRLVFAPNWLLAELYKAQPEAEANSSSGEQLSVREGSLQGKQQAVNYELVAYVIVGAGEQLGHIKTLVEENKLFRETPRDVYYVAARPTTNREQHNLDQDQLALVRPYSAKFPIQQHLYNLQNRVQHQQHLHMLQQQQQQFKLVDAVQLADEFQFSVPNLRPASRYKLLIYGQNLANRTRDWLVVRGETSADEGDLVSGTARSGSLGDARGQQSAATGPKVSLLEAGGTAVEMQGNKLVGSSLRTAPQDEPPPEGQAAGSGAQKSLVMRSGERQEEQSWALDEQEVAGGGGRRAGHLDSREPERQEQRLVEGAGPKVWAQRLAQLRERALDYAKGRPLLAVPAAIAVCLSAVLALLYVGGLFASCVARRRRARARRSRLGSGLSNAADKSADHDERDADDEDQDREGSGGRGDSEPSGRRLSGHLGAASGGRKCSAAGKLQAAGHANGLLRTGHYQHLLDDSKDSAEAAGRGAESAGQQREGAVFAALDPSSLDLRLLNTLGLEPVASQLQVDARQLQTDAAHERHRSDSLRLTTTGSLQAGSIASAAPLAPYNHAHQHLAGCQLVGSLDRRSWVGGVAALGQQQQQPMLVSSGGQHQLVGGRAGGLGQFGSIDRRTNQSQLVCGHQNYGGHSFLSDHYYVEPPKGDPADEEHQWAEAERASQTQTSAGRRAARQRHPQASGAPKRVVAFDLGHSVQWAGRETALGQPELRAGSQLDDEQETHKCHPGRPVTSGSSSASANTAPDSGHESPETNTTTTTTTGNGQRDQCSLGQRGACREHELRSGCQLHGTLLAAGRLQQVADSRGAKMGSGLMLETSDRLSCSPINLVASSLVLDGELLPNGHHQTSMVHSGQSHSQLGDPINCFMLMEMSPGSQEESSTTLLHSVDCSSSLCSSQFNGSATNGLESGPKASTNRGLAGANYSALQHHHQMSTSFASGPQQSAKAALSNGKLTEGRASDEDQASRMEEKNWL